jgi:hypothetical protein
MVSILRIPIGCTMDYNFMSLKSLAPEKDPVERNKTKNSSFEKKRPEMGVFSVQLILLHRIRC